MGTVDEDFKGAADGELKVKFDLNSKENQKLQKTVELHSAEGRVIPGGAKKEFPDGKLTLSLPMNHLQEKSLKWKFVRKAFGGTTIREAEEKAEE